MHRITSLFEDFRARLPGASDAGVVVAICEGLLDEGEVEPPVDVELLASLCGIASVEYRQQGPAGMLVRKDGAWVASILAADGLERRRFTILHEGGHTLLPDFKRATHYRCKGSRTREEQLCDIAAAELLLPRRFFLSDLAESDAGLGGVERLAVAYAASLQATLRRVVDLTSQRMALMVFRIANKPDDHGMAEPALRLDYAHHDGGWPFPLRHKSAPAGSVFDRAWHGEQIDEPTNVDAFFAKPVGTTHVSARRYGDKLLALLRPMTRTPAR